MSCYTLIQQLEDSEINRKARKALGLSVEGDLNEYDIARVKVEAGIIKARTQILAMDPKAIIVRKGNELTVTVMR